MPSGYTEKIYSGSVRNLKEWLDETWIPIYRDNLHELKHELNFHVDQLAHYDAELENFPNKTPEELRQDYDEYVSNTNTLWSNYNVDKIALKARYDSMLDEIHGESLKHFDADIIALFNSLQYWIDDSKNYDCRIDDSDDFDSYILNFDEYCANAKDNIENDIQYHKKEYERLLPLVNSATSTLTILENIVKK